MSVPLAADVMSRFVPAGRNIGIDVARGLALFGMIATHVVPLRTDDGSALFSAVFAGRASALFAVLAGFSVVLSTRRLLDRPGMRAWAAAAAGLVVRGLLIGFIGLLLGSLNSGIAVILVNYGVMFALAAVLLRVRTAILGWLAPLWLIAAPVLSFIIRRLGDLQPAHRVPGIGNALDVTWLAQAITVTGYYPVLQWMGYVVLGMFLARLHWRTVRMGVGAAIVGTATAVLSAGVSSLLLSAGGRSALEIATARRPGQLDQALHESSFGITPTDTWWWLAISGPHSGTPFDMVGTAAVAVAVIGLCAALTIWVRSRFGERGLVWTAPLSAPGSMPLSIYAAHVILITFTASSFGAPDGTTSATAGQAPLLASDAAEYAMHVFVFMIAAMLWKLGISARGPLETVVSTVSRAVSRSVSGVKTR